MPNRACVLITKFGLLVDICVNGRYNFEGVVVAQPVVLAVRFLPSQRSSVSGNFEIQVINIFTEI